jgi:hypothetical protein
MSISKRILDVAKANLNALLDKAADAADPRRKLSNVSDAELEAELSRRRDARAAEDRLRQARAKVDAPEVPRAEPAKAEPPKTPPPNSASTDREARERAAREREARVRAAQAERERAARERAAQATKQQQQRAGQRGAGQQSRRPPPRGSEGLIAQYYARLELPVGAPFEAVKTSYRRLMRKYHPDMHNGSPEKLRAATEVAQALTQAYNELEKHLMGGPNRR